MKQPAILNLESVTKQFSPTSYPAVTNVSFTLEEGELLGLLGPSGCGKTTLLRIIAGFEQPASGTICIAGKQVAGALSWLPPEKRNTGMVFQDYALFPHLSIGENIAFGLKRKKERLSQKQIKERVAEVLILVGLGGLEKRYPHQLSGGQQQRVALARALAPQPALMLLDEPLSNLDVQVRERLRHEVRSILKAARTSAIFVTHDQEEALAISDKIGVMREGNLEQLGTPEEIYTKPATRFVAEFVTQANFIPAKRQGKLWETEIGVWEINQHNSLNSGELMLRQEDIILKPDERAKIIVRERHFLGREYRYCLETASGKKLHARVGAGNNIPVGTRVQLSVTPELLQVF
ncbi:MAG: ABC transporter ATP-binding protein [Gomphosphaeria aponina SAG 52.96 = DSM 107014]|uniref:ABC-type quaternary amine transporter n=1 Tax=Gomphosphaeria aponina SAG 52.96 = DSM 107014 TaxID=1521640 RepID=A0A941GSZ9_9CHRO|nr:ABC transporter ATP-binding protein [Gomphosphaeria aponina SAG 52.96 = DSM 107014]